MYCKAEEGYKVKEEFRQSVSSGLRDIEEKVIYLKKENQIISKIRKKIGTSWWQSPGN